jgi:Flp pilus assembly protein TadD
MVDRILKAYFVVTTLMIIAVPAVDAQNVKVYHLSRDKNIGQGMQALRSHDFNSASYYLSKAAKSRQTKARKASLYNNVCAVDFVLKRFDSALDACNAAIKLDRKNWKLLLNRGNIYRDTGYFTLAKRDYRLAAKYREKELIILEAMSVLATFEESNNKRRMMAVNTN